MCYQQYWFVKLLNIGTRFFEQKCDSLLRLHQANNTTYTTTDVANQLLSAMANNIQDTLKQRIQSSLAYALLSDEATYNFKKKHIAFDVKYNSLETEETSTDFYRDVQINYGKAKTIVYELGRDNLMMYS